MAIKNGRRQAVYGLGPNAYSLQFPDPIVTTRDPQVTDVGGAIGQYWLNTETPAIFMLTGFSGGQAQWLNMIGGAGVFTSLTVSPGPISLTGTTHINTSGAATTSIGTGGTGAVNIGNATGNTAVTGQVVVSGNFFTTNGVVSAGSTTAAATSTSLQILKSRSGGVITTGDDLGNVIFAGYDGTQYTTGASIVSTSSGTIGSTRVAANLKFFTHPDSAGSETLRMTIASTGNVVVAAPDSGVGLTVSGGGATVTAGDVTLTNGNLIISTAAKYVSLPGPVFVRSGAGTPAGGLALHAGDLYINTTPTGVTDRLFIATGVGAWTFFTANA
jgi:hypothetical protein